MRILVSGDKHLGLVSDGMERLDEQERILDRVIEVLSEKAPDVYVDLGDLFHVPRPGPGAYELGIDYAIRLSDWATETGGSAYVLLGNHDQPTRGSVTALSPLEPVAQRLGGVLLVTAPAVEPRRTDPTLVFLPFVTEETARENGAEGAEEYLDAFAEETLRETEGDLLVFAHLEVPGARMSNDETVQRDTGLKIPRAFLDSKRVVRVYAGHVHKFQELERVTVVGSSLYVDFGEAADPKGMILAEV